MRKIIFVCCFVCCFCSYSFSQNSEPVVLDLMKAISEKSKILKLSDIASNIHYIPIETNSNCLFGDSYEIRYMKSEIFVATNGNFYRFDKNGKFLNKIGAKGQGPNEYDLGMFFFIDPDKKYFHTHDWSKIMTYSYEGTFVSKMNAPNLNMGTAEKLGKDYIVYSNDSYFSNRNKAIQLYKIDLEGNFISGEKGYIDSKNRYGINLTTRDLMYVFNKETYFKPALENIVYKLNESKKKKKVWKFDCSVKSIDISLDERNIKNRNKSISVYQIHETVKYLFVLYGFEKKVYTGMFDKADKTFQNVIIKDDLSGGLDFVPAGKCCDGFLEMAYFPIEFREEFFFSDALLPDKKKKLNEIVAMDDEDNPVLIVVELK